MIKIRSDKENEDVCLKTDCTGWLDNEEQRQLLLWFKQNRPEMCRDIFCDGCPEA